VDVPPHLPRHPEPPPAHHRLEQLRRQQEPPAVDSAVFVREEDDKLHIGLRRATHVFCGGGNAGSPGAIKESMQAPWCRGLRFKMPFETEDLSRISWFMGTVAGVEPADPARWPQSPWRLLQVRVNKRTHTPSFPPFVLPLNRSVNRGCCFSNFIGDLGRA